MFPHVYSLSQFSKLLNFHFFCLFVSSSQTFSELGRAKVIILSLSYTTLQFCCQLSLYIYDARLHGFKSLLCHLLAV